MPLGDDTQNPATNGTIERTAILMYALLQELRLELAAGGDDADVELGMLMGLSMFLDDRLGPFRADRLMAAAPGIILRTDAHVVRAQTDAVRPALRSFGHRLLEGARSAEGR